LERVHNSRFRW